MLIERRSPLTGKLNQREINVTAEQLIRWKDGGLIQKVMPDISDDDREFLISGFTPEDWNELFSLQSEGRSDQAERSTQQPDEAYW